MWEKVGLDFFNTAGLDLGEKAAAGLVFAVRLGG
jgi:hypothetical protein